MRFSKLAYLHNMCNTLQEAVRYLQQNTEGDTATDILTSGQQMLSQIANVLVQNTTDLKTDRPLKILDKIAAEWVLPLEESIVSDLTELQSSLKNDIHFQIRAVFFAGLGSVWDAMDSLYWYMKQDPRFDPVVVLIPVFRAAQQDGEIKTEVIYKDYLTPMGIPFYDYRKYSLENDLPELAFTSQPYESVILKQFWPENISKYTRLVYLPYFIPEIMHNHIRAELCELEIYKHAWRVAAFSDKFAQYFCKHSLRKGDNIMRTGTPKMDYIVHLAKNDCKHPVEWDPIIQNKTVFLWNTWYDWNVSTIDMLEDMLSWFQENSDYALIWRPHPMTKIVTKLHYPQYTSKLEKLINFVKNSDNMIFDEEASYAASFKCSDALISAPSSIMTQYQMMNKPVLWLNYVGGTVQTKLSEEVLIRTDWMERADNVELIKEFVIRVHQGIDRNKNIRNKILQEDIPWADGHVAERISNTLWTDLCNETKLMGE